MRIRDDIEHRTTNIAGQETDEAVPPPPPDRAGMRRTTRGSLWRRSTGVPACRVRTCPEPGEVLSSATPLMVDGAGGLSGGARFDGGVAGEQWRPQRRSRQSSAQQGSSEHPGADV